MMDSGALQSTVADRPVAGQGRLAMTDTLTIEAPPVSPPGVDTLREEGAQMLRSATRLIEEHGWVQGASRHDGRYCMIGALHALYWRRADADPGTEADHDHLSAVYIVAKEALEETVKAETGGILADDIVSYNDTPGRTEQEVLSVMREAARRTSLVLTDR